MCVCTVAGDFRFKAVHISLIDGGYLLVAMNFFMYINMSFCLLVKSLYFIILTPRLNNITNITLCQTNVCDSLYLLY